jgi:diguanylate cyclase (GGDEF)-like protein
MMMADKPSLSFSAEDLEAICRVAAVKEFAAGETIFSLGDEDRRMFYIKHGEVELFLGGGTTPKTIGQGSFFGELAFVLPRFRRTATAKAKSGCVLVCLEQSIYEVLIRENPQLLCTLLRNTCEYLLSSEQSLIASLSQKNRELENTLRYLRETREELGHQEVMAHTDELTGLFNRRGLNAFIGKFVEQAQAVGNGLGLVMVDLDNFKKINDTWGHDHGDEVLKKVASILKSQTRQSDVVCRRGGDEFVILLPGITTERGLELAEKIRCRIEEEFPADPAGIKLSGSLGLAFFSGEDSAGDLLLRADRNLYLAKNGGRNQVAFRRA